jgi:ABC-2 type transport system ATP-binding protein
MHALSVKQLTKTYPNGVMALKGIDLEVKQGDFFALLGKNGAGKSTTIGIICSLVNKTAGTVSVFGHDMDVELAKAKSLIGVVPQEMNFSQFEQTTQILINQAGYYGVPAHIAKTRAELYLQEMGLWDVRNQPAMRLSGGMKRRLMIARALMNDPKLLILDEPTAGVDIELRHTLWKFLTKLNQQGTTIILTTHYLEEAEHLCKHVAIIDHGDIIEHANMKSFINRLDVQTIILDLASPLQHSPSLDGFETRLDIEGSLEVVIHRRQSINELFQRLTDAGIQVASMRNKTNRLEELFLHSIANSGH